MDLIDPRTIAKQMISYNKTLFDAYYNAAVMLQDQMETIANMSLDQAPWLPKEGRKAIDEWAKAYKTAREDFKKTVDDIFKEAEKLFS